MSLSKLHNTLLWEPNNSSITKKKFAFSLSVFKRLMILHYLISREGWGNKPKRKQGDKP